MSSRKCKQNDENLCPVPSKRSKTVRNSPIKTSQPGWVAAKLESTSSPTGLSNEYLEEMGVVLLDSEESSSSASSAISFAAALTSVMSSTDENCNEATPNLDAPKFQHQPHPNTYGALDQTADNSPVGSNETQIGCHTNNNSNSSFEIYIDESSQQKSLPLRKTWLQHKTVALLSESPVASSPASGHKRSPLTAVTCNTQLRNDGCAQQQQHQSPSQQLPNTLRQKDETLSTPNNVAHGLKNCTHDASQGVANFSPSQPSTSQQAALRKQQQQLQKLQAQKLQPPECQPLNQKEEQLQSKQLAPPEEFFLFRNRKIPDQLNESERIDHFGLLSDEIILQIFKWLPKKTLLRCSSVCRRFQQCAADESLWTRLDLGSRSLRPEVMDHILSRGVVILRLAQSNLREPVFQNPSPHPELKGQSKLQFLDLSLAQIDKQSLKTLLSYCRQLKKLSLEHVPLNSDICNEIAENTNLEALNLAMCTGLEAWCIRKLLESLKNLNSLNISWTNLSVDAVTALVTHVTPNLMRLNVAGCRKTMFDTHIASLVKRCSQLLELDLSDCTGLTGNAINILCGFKMLEYLSLSRCYLIPAMSYLELKNLPTLAFLDVFGTLSDPAMDLLERTFPGLGINKFVHSSVARPTVGTRRTSIWGLRTRD